VAELLKMQIIERPMTNENSNKNSNDGFMTPDIGRSLPMALLLAREAVMERFRPILSSHNINEQQWRVLRVLDESGKMEASQVAVRACILPPSLTRIIKILESCELIVSCKDKNDGRRTLLDIDKKGRELIALVSPESGAVYAEIEAVLGHDEVAHLLDILDELQKSLKGIGR
jgi:homoprotocatechuate degradation regulator HpaR